MNNDVKEMLVSLGLGVETLEGTHALLEDLLEEFTAASMSVNARERNKLARLKMVTLLKLMEYELKGMNNTLNELEEGK